MPDDPTPAADELPLSCLEVARVLQAHLDGELAAGEAHSVADHLDGCHGCDLEAEAYREIKAALRRCPADLRPDTVARLRRFASELAEDG